MSLPHQVGLIGLGLLGSALAERFLAANIRVIAFDLDPAKTAAAVTAGCHSSPSTAAVFHSCETVVLSLPTSGVVRAVLGECDQALRPGLCILDTTTGDPEDAVELGHSLFSRGIHYLDATVAGSSDQTRRGEVTVMIGGEKDIAERFYPLFDTFARHRFHVGGWGSGARMKLVVNLVLGLNRAVLAEGLALARACGIDMQEALNVLQATPASSHVMHTKGGKMIAGDFTPQARLSQHRKDVDLILALAGRLGARVPLSQLHRDLLVQLEAAGCGGEDNAAIIKAFL